MHIIFLSNTILHEESNKFVLPKLDTPSLRYEFLKHAFKSRKINQKIKTSHRLRAEARGQRDPPISETKIGDGADRRELADGEVTDDEVTAVVFPIITRIYGYPRFGQRNTRATLLVSMAAQRWCSDHL